MEIERYRSRISGPLLDRIDIHLEVPAVAYRDLVGAPSEEPSAAIRARVERARVVQRERFRGRQPKREGERPGGRLDDQIDGTARLPSATITAEPSNRTATTLSPSRSHSTCMRLGRPISMP